MRGKLIKPLAATQAAYVAGIVDGEGCVSISRKKDHKGMVGGYAYRPYVLVSNTNRLLMAWLVEITGLGSVRAVKKRKGHKQAWAWVVWSQQARQLIEAIRPYMVLKGTQADVVLKLLAAARNPGQNGLKPAEREFQAACCSQVRTLNKRGTA